MLLDIIIDFNGDGDKDAGYFIFFAFWAYLNGGCVSFFLYTKKPKYWKKKKETERVISEDFVVVE